MGGRCREGIQLALGSYVKFPVDNRGCGQYVAIKFVSGQHVQLLAGIEDRHNAFFRCDVDLVVGRHGRRVVISRRSRAAAVHQRACLRVSGENDAAVVECIEAPVVVKRLGNAGYPLVLRPCDVSMVHLVPAARRPDMLFVRSNTKIKIRYEVFTPLHFLCRTPATNR